MTTSEQGKAFIRRQEGFRPTAYEDGAGWSVGYGHNGVSAGTTVTEAEAEALLDADLRLHYEPAVEALGLHLGQSQFDALVSLAYNAGPGAVQGGLKQLLLQSTTPREELRAWWTGHYITSGGKRLEGLVRRREEEYALYASAASEKKNSTAGAVAVAVAAAVAAVAVAILLKKDH